MQSNLFQMKEIELARRYVESHHIRHDMKRDCPVCGKDTGVFFTKWEVDYLRCSECDSIFAVCDEAIASDYLVYDELMKLRLSNEYQSQISESRNTVWREFLEWVEVRAYRFLRRNKGLNIVDVGNRMSGLADMTRESELCGKYTAVDSLGMMENADTTESSADIIFYASGF